MLSGNKSIRNMVLLLLTLYAYFDVHAVRLVPYLLSFLVLVVCMFARVSVVIWMNEIARLGCEHI